MSSVAVRYFDLGPMAIERGGVVVPVTAQRVSSALACLLVRVNNTVSPDALIDAVWSGHPPDGAEATLDSHLWRLTQLLESRTDLPARAQCSMGTVQPSTRAHTSRTCQRRR